MSINRFRKVILAALILGIGISSIAAQHRYRTYKNTRFNYSITYPADILIPQGESANRDGQKFRSRDGRAEMLVYGSHNALNQTLRQLYSEEISHPHRTVTYKTLKGNWFVVSGIEDGKVFYKKSIFSRGVFKSFRIDYDESQKKLYDSLTARMARSFRG